MNVQYLIQFQCNDFVPIISSYRIQNVELSIELFKMFVNKREYFSLLLKCEETQTQT